ncbi:MAG: hypothetical protein WCE21_00605 [Candidatus Babeliales bacterium]
MKKLLLFAFFIGNSTTIMHAAESTDSDIVSTNLVGGIGGPVIQNGSMVPGRATTVTLPNQSTITVDITQNMNTRIQKHTSNGTLDTTFGTGGTGIVIDTNVVATRFVVNNISGTIKLVEMGPGGPGTNIDVLYTAQGTIDLTYGTNGIRHF